ncbi:hypothetical protein ACOME3_008961 [Neoechinorhynchus agilis]
MRLEMRGRYSGYNEKRLRLWEFLIRKLESHDIKFMTDHVNKSGKKHEDKIKAGDAKKLRKLGIRKENDIGPEAINLSSKNLSEDVMKVLNPGPEFVPFKRMKDSQIRCDFEIMMKRVPGEIKSRIAACDTRAIIENRRGKHNIEAAENSENAQGR